MAKLIKTPTRIEAAGNKPKLIDEFFGQVNSGTSGISIARMQSPSGWVEPGQTPEFDEYTVVLRSMLKIEGKEGRLGSECRARRGHVKRRMDSLQHSRTRRGRIYCGVPSSLLASADGVRQDPGGHLEGQPCEALRGAQEHEL